MTTIKRISLVLLALAIITCSIIALSWNSSMSMIPTSLSASVESIYSDGKAFPLPMIEALKFTQESSEEALLPSIANRETLLKLLLDRGALYDPSKQQHRNYEFYGDLVVPSMAMDMDDAGMAFESSGSALAAPEDAGGGTGGTPAHSETNEQVEGVSEGDIVKTDGRFIYAMAPHSDTLRIIQADGAQLKVLSTINSDISWGSEFYLVGDDRLAVVGSEYIYLQPVPMPEPAADSQSLSLSGGYYGEYSNSFTVAVIYDISDRSAPAEVRRVAMDGWNVSTRVIGNTLYLVTNKHIWHIPYDQADSGLILPYCRDTSSGDAFEPVAYENMYFIPDTDDTSYLLVGAIDIYGDEPFEPTAYFGAGSDLYMSRNAMYVTKSRWERVTTSETVDDDSIDWQRSPSNHKTDILRFAINGVNVTYTGIGTADGSPINQYSMDEHNGYFRIATTDWGIGTYVTVMNASTMQTVGRTEPLAPEEQMYSARFMGDMGYVVTFHIVDPLFTIDLSDPYNPSVLGELKIPGFSQYLHPVGDGLLMGIGRDTQEIYTRDANGVESVINFIDVGLKVSLFDVSDPFDPREVDVLSLGEGWTEVSNNPRALMTDSRNGLYGFITESWVRSSRGHYSIDAILLRVDKGKVTIASSLAIEESHTSYGNRLCFIGNTLYVVYESGVDAYDYTTFAKLGGISF